MHQNWTSWSESLWTIMKGQSQPLTNITPWLQYSSSSVANHQFSIFEYNDHQSPNMNHHCRPSWRATIRCAMGPTGELSWCNESAVKIGVPLDHPTLVMFTNKWSKQSTIAHPFWGAPNSKKHPYWWRTMIYHCILYFCWLFSPTKLMVDCLIHSYMCGQPFDCTVH